ncbi:MAG: RimK family alpha-L-glutamate ligase [Bdellovibrionales bacterium CG12_big_fil_rev_8_21_14_0_65_38_15]|nr:MAG: RimK family alpha-L-glutamate ligase [Bdellovibrionales bacterium CG22_combo_CG10-13_8_21_14_all_38_13]PIQ56986.1 MAG: RimK family alpha-L-glutamate ligase [Bdellovibrionales bacterium CG12_big_fil_rev_8_21_14_0_65_38_15]PIR29053.1 MAG: RimK family alpha-L-glutamate ligase [Bdellovibrionales bacterium CG11_big_fil_rev_8_21_14_0_20_38_13]
MGRSLVVVDDKFHHLFAESTVQTISPIKYILENVKDEKKRAVYNLSSSYGYQDLGYYVSLLASARNDKVYPSPRTIQDLKDKKIQQLLSEDLFELIQSKLSKLQSDKFELSIYFGENISTNYKKLAWELYRIIQAPMFRVYLEKEKEWSVKRIKILTFPELAPAHLEFAASTAIEYLSQNKVIKSTNKKMIYDLAILYNEDEVSPPSDKVALEMFVDAFREAGFYTKMIQQKERPNISEYDALFIRETTNVTHHTYRMARNAEKEGLVVIDDPLSIVKCTNKVFLEQLMERLNLDRPKTFIYDKKLFQSHFKQISLPCVLKKPDSAFSQGVHKARNEDELIDLANTLFQSTELILIQEFLPTDFDWRIGILGGEVIYACKYYMAKDHWQIINNADGAAEGGSDCIDPKDVDPKVLKTSLKLAKAIGNGLYGIDLKQKGDKIYLIEINDNPSIEHGVEDKLLGKALYQKIAQYFLKQCHEQRGIHA